MRERILKDAMNAAADVLVAEVKRNARRSVRTGALYAAIEKKVVVYNKGLGEAVAVGMVGISKNYYRRGGVKVKQDNDGFVNKEGAEQPSRYAHLIEFGHAVRQPKKGRTIRKGNAVMPNAGKLVFVPPRPFMRPAFASSERSVYRALLQGVISGIDRHRTKAIESGAHAA